jgi:hypothetical protein
MLIYNKWLCHIVEVIDRHDLGRGIKRSFLSTLSREHQVKKLTLAAMIIGGFAAQAQAQSNVTIYGLVDAGVVSERGGAAGSLTKVTSGIGGQSRLGFKGTEDLGNGLSAIFQLETGFKADDGRWTAPTPSSTAKPSLA